jgi:hypothetical protein
MTRALKRAVQARAAKRRKLRKLRQLGGKRATRDRGSVCAFLRASSFACLLAFMQPPS